MCPKSPKEEEQLSKENLRLKSAVEVLSILNDIATAIASTQSLNQITNLIVKKCVKHLKSEQGSIQLVDEKDFVNPFHTMIRVKDRQRDIHPLRFDQQISDWMLANKYKGLGVPWPLPGSRDRARKGLSRVTPGIHAGELKD